MTEKYDLDQMLKEIEEDEILDPELKKVKMSQEDILSLIKKRRKEKGDKA